jgi:very-short-patch-repair endonuclease
MVGDWSESEEMLRLAANDSTRNRLIVRIAARQRQLICLHQLVDLGLTQRAVQLRAQSGRLHRVHRRVYATHAPPYSDRQRYLAAVYACGPGSLLSDLPAAFVYGFVELAPGLPHVTNRMGTGRRLPGIIVHRRLVDPQDARVRHGIPCTSPARTLVDCATALPIDRLEDLLMAADASRMLNRGRLEALAQGRLLSLIEDDPKETASKNERRFLSLCREAGVPEPLVNHRVDIGPRTFYADFCWPELRLIVEADSWRWHGGRLASESDADRAQLLALAGWRVVRFTRDQIKNDRAETGRRLVALTAPVSSRGTS